VRTMRTVALILLGVSIAGLSSLSLLIWWLGARRGVVVGAAAGAIVLAIYVSVIGPWQRRWGATDIEVRRHMPGDELLGPEAASTTRVITVGALPEDVFPWLLQIGYARGGWYSYDWIDNDGRPSVDRIDPSLQLLDVGDRIEMLPGFGPTVREIAAGRYILSGGDTDSWCLLVEPTPDGKTRLISRWRQRWTKTLGTRLWIAIVDPGAFLMEQKMLRTIRDLAERTDGPFTGSSAQPGAPRSDRHPSREPARR
jgi:hypothetical protein